MNHLTAEELRQAVNSVSLVQYVALSPSFKASLLAAIRAHMDKLIAECGVEPVMTQYKKPYCDSTGECIGYGDWQNSGASFWPKRDLITTDQLAAAVARERIARQDAQIENEALKSRIAKADAEKASEVLPLQKRIDQLLAQVQLDGKATWLANDNLTLTRENIALKEQVDALKATCLNVADTLKVGVAVTEVRFAQDTFAPPTNEDDVIVTKATDVEDMWYIIPAVPGEIFQLSKVASPTMCTQLKFPCKDKETAMNMYHEQGWELVQDPLYYGG